ncbi:MAG: M48 family metalloprotease [Euryarchaeota archaeon]|nr:M48 family metalloprotease [Euryarchaeota archaeon]MCG2738274.1 M48 family metalloprotease [Candidatus Methanoperedenaceae archaeon]
MVDNLDAQNERIDRSLGYQRLKLKIIFAITLLVIAGSLILVISLLSGGSILTGLLILIGFGIFYAYETNKEFNKLSALPPLDHPEIIEMVRRLSENGNIEPPVVLAKDEIEINAYALSTPRKSYIILPKGIIDSFDNGNISKEEMESILAHELGHIINKDSFISAGLWFTIRLFTIIQNILNRIQPYIARITKKSAETTRRYGDDGMAGWMLLGMTLFLVFMLVLVIVSSISLFILISICVFFINFLGRQQEHVADIISARLTQKPEMMASALHTIDKLYIMGTPSTELSPYQSAIMNTPTLELNNRKLTLSDRWNEYKSTHPNLINRVNILLTPRFFSNRALSLKDRLDVLNLKKYPLKELPVIKILNMGIPLSHSIFHGIILGIFIGIVSLIVTSFWLTTQFNYLLLFVVGAWIGLFSISKTYPADSSFNMYSLDTMFTLVFVFLMTFSLLTSIATGVLAFYSTIILGILIMVPVSIVSAFTLSYIKKNHIPSNRIPD